MFNQEEKSTLLALAHQSIGHGLQHGSPLPVRLADFPARLIQFSSCFVSLTCHGQFCGSMGGFFPRHPLVEVVVQNAFSAAFLDRRFQPVTLAQQPHLRIEISIVQPPKPLVCSSESDLCAKLRPGVDGLIIYEGPYTATFLPSVWVQWPDPKAFVNQLKLKAGLAADHWSEQIKFQVYATEQIQESS